MAPARVLYWFRTDLRLHDSPALKAALDLGGQQGIEAFYPIWCFDPQYVWKHKVGVNRWQFLLESMQDVSDSLKRVNDKQRLHVLRGSPDDVLPVVWKDWGITHMVFEKDTAAYGNSGLPGGAKLNFHVARQRDEYVVNTLVKQHAPHIKIIIKDGHNLLDPELVITKGNNGKCITTLVSWKKAAAKVGPIPKPLPTVTSLPDPGSLDLPSAAERKMEEGTMDGPYARLEGENVNHDIMDKGRFDCFASISGPDHDFAVPTLSSLGLGLATTTIHGGETEALRRLDAFLADKSRTATFSKPASAPTSLEPSTTQLSPYLKFGCLSVRGFYWRAKEVIDSYVPKKGETVTKEPENLLGQLEFREMYYCAEFATPKYDRVRGNPLSRFMNWALMNHYDEKGEMIMPRPRGKEADEEKFIRWKEGRTGFPWIDAVMRQLKHEGWIHHLARHSVACFLTRGQCYISWERGTEVFDEYLLDWDPASNPGNWMWLSCSAFFSQYFRVYGLVSWPQKTDKTGALVRKYCPELKGFPDKYIYAPHLAPLAVQEKAKCIIGTDYPHPMLDEKHEKERCIARLKIAFSEGLHGNAPQVLDGSAEGILKRKFRDAMGNEEGGRKGRTCGRWPKAQGRDRSHGLFCEEEQNLGVNTIIIKHEQVSNCSGARR